MRGNQWREVSLTRLLYEKLDLIIETPELGFRLRRFAGRLPRDLHMIRHYRPLGVVNILRLRILPQSNSLVYNAQLPGAKDVPVECNVSRILKCALTRSQSED